MTRVAKLGDFLARKTRGIVPNSMPDERFELYSVPSFEEKVPELVAGHEIGSNKQIVEPGTVLLCKINPRINRAWYVSSFSEHKKIASTEWLTFPPHLDIEPKYLASFLSQSSIRDFLSANASGVGGSLMRVKGATIQDLEFPLPDRSVQRAVVAELEKQFSRLDEAVATLQRVKANLKRYKASVLKDAVEGRLVPTEAELARREGRTFETGEQLLQRILEERRAKWVGKGKFKEPLPIASEGIGLTPEGWGWATVEMICESIVDCPHSTARFHANGFPCVDTTWMTTEGLVLERARYVDETTYLDRISRLTPRPGDIVFAREGTIGTAVLIPERMTPCLGQRVMLLRASEVPLKI